MPCSDATETGHGRDGSMAGGSELRSSAKWQLRCANERTERGKQHRSSQRVQWWPRRARGGTGADEFDEDGRRVRGRRRRRWRRCGTSGASWLVEEVEGGPAELPGASVRLGVAGGHGYGDDGGELRSVVCARGKQRREWGPGERGEVQGARASPWREGEARERLGGSRRWPGPLGRAPRLASVRPPGRGGRGQGGGGGLGRPVLDQHRSWAGSGGLHG